MLLFKLRVTWSVSFIHWSVLLWCSWNPNWLAFSKFLSSVHGLFSELVSQKSFPVVDRRLIGRKFRGNFGFLPGFGIMILASFQNAGKLQSRKHWLNKCVMWTRDLGRFLKQRFGMPSIPQTFRNIRDRISFETSHDRNLTEGCPSAVVSRAWTRASTHRSWSVSQNSCGVNRFSKQFTITLTLSSGKNCKA
jgi:hypothetical protein